nr:ribonuclease H-like domain, reverse transcriptase, RNA-dependent DNA polymerase [Tanacetum cinerariifolium]
MAIPEDHLAKFNKITDAKQMWEAIKSIFDGNDESKKMQKYTLRQQFEGFYVSNSDGLHKGYDRSLPSSWSQVSLITKTKLRVDTLSFDDLYNNLRVFESDVKGSTTSSSSTQNVAFVSSDNTNSTNEVSTAYGVSTSFGHNSQKEDHEDLEQGDEFDLEEMDLKWQVAMISKRLKKFLRKTGRKLHFNAKKPVGFDKTKVECFNCRNTGHFAKEFRSKGNQESKRRDTGNTRYKARDNERRPAKQDEHKAMVTIDGDGVDWTGHVEDDTKNYALMAFNSSTSGSDTEVTSCSEACEESYAKLKKLYDEQREQVDVASIEIQAYTLALKKKLLAEADKEKEELKTKLENFQSSFKGLSKLLNSQMSAKDKSGLGRSSDVEDSPVNDRFTKVKGIHAVPPPMTEIYMPPKSDFGIDKSKFTYGQKQSKTSESDAKTNNLDSCESNSSVETLESMPTPFESKPKAVSEPKVWSDAPIIEEYESNSDDEYVSLEKSNKNVNEYVFKASMEQEKPSCAFINTVKHVKTPRQTVKNQDTCSQNHKVPKRDWTSLMSKRLGLGYGYTRKACFVCGSFSHLIRDCDSNEKRMAKQVELNKSKNKVTCQRNDRPVWNNVQRLNHQNKFVPTAILTKTGRFPVNVARQKFSSQAALTSTVRKVNTARQIVNEIKPRNNVYKSHSPIRRPFNRTPAPKANFINHKVNTAEDKIDNPHQTLNGKGIVDSGCSRHMTRNKAYLVEYQDFNGALLLLEVVKVKSMPVIVENKANKTAGPKEANNSTEPVDQEDQAFLEELESLKRQELLKLAGATRASSTNYVNTASTLVNTGSPSRNILSLEDIYEVPNDGIFTSASYDDKGAVVDFTNLESTVNATQTRSKVNKSSGAHAFVSYIQKKRHNNHKDFQHCLFACFLSQIKPKKISQAIKDESWIDAMQEELLQFKTQQVWILVDVPFKKKVIRTKWVYRNKKDERGVVVRSKARLVSHGHRQEEGIDYDEVFASVARTEAIRIFLAFGSYMGFIVYQMDVKSAFLYGKIDEEVHVSQPSSFIDPKFPKKVKQKEDEIFISRDKYVAEILKKFDFMSVKTASTPIETKKPLVKDAEAADVDVYLYRSMIGSLMYLIASRPDIMYEVCACSRFQVTPKTSHLHAVKRIFRYHKGQPTLGFWYPRESAFDLEAYLDSDYAGANLDRKSITGGCQFLIRKLIS